MNRAISLSEDEPAAVLVDLQLALDRLCGGLVYEHCYERMRTDAEAALGEAARWLLAEQPRQALVSVRFLACLADMLGAVAVVGAADAAGQAIERGDIDAAFLRLAEACVALARCCIVIEQRMAHGAPAAASLQGQVQLEAGRALHTRHAGPQRLEKFGEEVGLP